MLVGLILLIYGLELVDGMLGKYQEMRYFEISAQGFQFKKNHIQK